MDEEQQNEVEFWHSVFELHEAMLAKCLWVPGLSREALNRTEYARRCEWCIGHTSGREAFGWTYVQDEPAQIQLDLGDLADAA